MSVSVVSTHWLVYLGCPGGKALWGPHWFGAMVRMAQICVLLHYVDKSKLMTCPVNPHFSVI